MSELIPGALLREIRDLINAARSQAQRQVNSLLVYTNFEIGRRIVEHEQGGKARAGYGEGTLKQLSMSLTAEFGKGFSVRNLRLIRQFFLTYRPVLEKRQTPFATSEDSSKVHVATAGMLPLSWSKYVFLMGISNPDERSFYELESANQGWSLRELKRQFDTSIYERLALSRDIEGVHDLARKGQEVTRPSQLLKDPYVLDFLGLEERSAYTESELESGIIDKLEQFLLELGKGFLFESRQRRFTFDADHFYVDLVFYNRLLRCYVLIDLKIGKLTHQDLGQMQMYVNYFDREVKLTDEHPTVGIILCKKKHDALVEITLPADANIHAREYSLYLPSKAELRARLMEWTAQEPEEEESP